MVETWLGILNLDSINHDTKISDFDVSVRLSRVCLANNIQTLGQLAENAEFLKRYARGVGNKTYKEINELVSLLSTPETADLFKTPEYMKNRIATTTSEMMGLMYNVQIQLIRVAAIGHISKESISQIKNNLQAASDLISGLEV